MNAKKSIWCYKRANTWLTPWQETSESLDVLSAKNLSIHMEVIQLPRHPRQQGSLGRKAVDSLHLAQDFAQCLATAIASAP